MSSTFTRNSLLSQRQFRNTSQALRSRKHLIVKSEKVLIVNTKGGGHAFIGYHLAKQLLQGGHTVSIVNDGSEEKITKSDPFTQYQQLKKDGVDISYISPKSPSEFPSQDFDVIVDNNGKDLDSSKPLIDHFKGKAKQHIFIASAGAYKYDSTQPLLVEGDERKASAGHVEVEKYLVSEKIPHTVIHPQYIYGPYTAKSYEAYFIDRIIRDMPVLLPSPGIQLTSLTHVEDIAQLVAKAVGNPKAMNEHFNACTDRFVTFAGIVKIFAQALQKEPKIAYYNPAEIKLEKGQGVPFRDAHFIASCVKAKYYLDFKPEHKFDEDASQIVKAYVGANKHEKADLEADKKILSQLS